jgi:CHAT domain-containing protein
MKTVIGAAAALRRAQLDARRQFPSFATWGAFLVVGEPG